MSLELPALRVRRLSLEVESGPDSGLTAALDSHELSVGTHPSNDLVLSSDRTVSRFHCRFLVAEEGIRVVDSTSANGTLINGVRVKDGYIIEDARITLGNTIIAARFLDTETEIEIAASFGDAIGRSVVMRRVLAMAQQVARSETSVLLLGETGTGKSLLAQAIHAHSSRSAGPLVVFDCGAVAPTLIESALFGHEKGAFTGADSRHEGVFERAHNGSLFLDEIGELPLSLQPKLLRALESGRILRLGAKTETVVNVRIIAATNRDLREMVGERFRSDLYYRLAVFPIEIPPLRERPEDIPLYAAHFLRQAFLRNGLDPEQLPKNDRYLASLSRHKWPGNTRELQNTIERAFALSGSEGPQQVVARVITLCAGAPASVRGPLPLDAARERFDREYFEALLLAADGHVAQAAAIAQIHPKSLTRLLRKLKIEAPRS